MMTNIFPEPILQLPFADIPLEGLKAWLAQGKTNQILFMEFEKEVKLAEHSHAAQWSIVLNGKIELTINGEKHTFIKGDTYYIPRDVKHGGFIHAGYTDITFFDQPDRYQVKDR